eukprot:SAG22_NODE_1209_length_5162_cov_16.551649_5_plen_90_part_00
MGGVPYTVRLTIVSEEGEPKKKWVVMGAKVVKYKKEGQPPKVSDEKVVMDGMVFNPNTGAIDRDMTGAWVKNFSADYRSKHKLRYEALK